ncbi:MAG: hypothetical protein AAF497_14655 [Planctomycetota bacterium]
MSNERELTGDSAESIQEILVAYLDGEVSTETRAAIEQRLADDESYRNELVKLQQSWQLLDQLPTAKTDANVTKSTIAMVAVDVKRELTGEMATGPSQNGSSANTTEAITRELDVIPVGPDRKSNYTWVFAAAAAALGFLAVFMTLRNQHRAELYDLPVAENIDLYRYAEDVEFLSLLDQANLFEIEESDAP